MPDITVSGLNKYFGDLHVLRSLSLELQPGERASIVGPNGCGKTTLLKIISGSIGFESGAVAITRGRRLGMLEQLPDYGDGIAVRDVLWQAFEHIEDIGREMAVIEQNMARGDTSEMNRYSALQTSFEAAGGYDLDLMYRRMTNGLRIDEDMQRRPFSSLSGGEKTRVNLARIMLSGTDILLLDEPTNHLDIRSIEWLEDYLRGFKGSVLIVSHDRYFLDRVTTRTLELYDGAITSWPGNYSYFVDKKQEMMEQLEAAKKRQDKEIARLEFTVERMKGWGLGDKKMMRRAFAMEKRIERIERIETIRREHKMRSRFAEAARSGEEVFTLQELKIGYNEPLIRDFSANVLRGERIAILGPNGCGKTTLLMTLLKRLDPMSGRIFEGVGLKKGYLPQSVTFSHPHRTLVDTLLYETNCSTQQARDRLAAFEFKGEDVFKTVEVLSGGEKTRLKLCVFMFSKVNTLFLDEPTNHLDILSREWIEDAIDDFSETMLFVSHDRYFINRFATRIWAVENGRMEDFIGTYEEYLQQQARLAQLQAKPPEGKKSDAQPRKNAAPPQRSTEKLRREYQRRLDAAERRLGDIEREMAECGGDKYERLGELFILKEQVEAELLEIYADEPPAEDGR